MNIQLFDNCESRHFRYVSWQEMYAMVCGENLRFPTSEFRRMKDAGDEAGMKRFKARQFPAMLPASVCDSGRRRTDDITSYTGFVQADFDHLPPDRVEDIMSRVRLVPEVLMAFRSMSGHGVHVYFQYAQAEGTNPAADKDLYLQAFRQGNRYLSDMFGAEYDQGTEPAVHLSSLCYDPQAYFNEDARPFLVDMSRPIKKRSVKDDEAKDDIHYEPINDQELCEYAKDLIDRNDTFTKGNRHNYLVKLLLLLSDYGVSATDAESFLMLRFPDYRDEKIPLLVTSCYKYVQGSFGTRKRPSRRTLSHVGKQGKGREPNPDKPSKVQIIEDFLNKQNLRYDLISRKVQTSPSPSIGGGVWHELSDRDINSLWRQCNLESGENISYQMFRPMLMSDCIPAVNPLVDYLDNLPKWDETTDYIGQVAEMVTSPSPSEGGGVFAECFKKWFVAMVASWLNPEIVNHQVLVLIGEQGIYKTTWLDALMPPELSQYRSKQSGTDRLDKDEMLRASEFGLVNLDEIDKMNERELNALKSLITTTDVNVRAAYGYGKERRIRIASYVASGNKDRFLTDSTGNRRWLPFKIESILSPYDHPMPYEGMYAQARWLYEHGFNYWFSLDEIRSLSEHVNEFMVETNEEQLIPVYFAVPSEGSPDALFLTTAEISAKLTAWGNIKHPVDLRRLGQMMYAAGFKSVRRGAGSKRGFIVTELSAEYINSRRRLDGK